MPPPGLARSLPFGNTAGDATFPSDRDRFLAHPLLYMVAAGTSEESLAFLETTSHDSTARGDIVFRGPFTFEQHFEPSMNEE